MAYERVQQEWPWAGVVNTWYLKRATDDWLKQGRPEAYFRLVDPDFTLQPVYQSLKGDHHRWKPDRASGHPQPAALAIQAEGPWQTEKASNALFGELRQALEPGARLSFRFNGSRLRFVSGCSQVRPATAASASWWMVDQPWK